VHVYASRETGGPPVRDEFKCVTLLPNSQGRLVPQPVPVSNDFFAPLCRLNRFSSPLVL
jgi:hypothetical protein